MWNEDNDGMNASERQKFKSPYGSMAFDRKGGSSSVVKIGKKEKGTKWKKKFKFEDKEDNMMDFLFEDFYLGAISKTTEWSQFVSKSNHSISR